MATDISNAMNAYQQALGRIAKNPALEALNAAQKNESQDSFSSMVKDAVQSVATASKNSENMTIAGMQGKADVQDVVMAISNAEVALDTVVAFRDTAIKAYKEIMQMTI